MADIDLKTLTPGTAAASSVIVGATSTGAASPSLFTSTGSGNVVLDTSPSLTTPTLGVASATSVNKLTITAPATGSTLTILDGKTLTANNTLTLTGTDGTTMTFPSTSGTVATLNVANLFTKANTFQPDSDAQAGTFRRNSSGQTANVVEIQTEANATLAYVDKLGNIGGTSAVFSQSAARSVQIDTRPQVTTFPVPYFRPSQTNSTIAFDVMPNGTPSEYGTNGYAWIDVCAADMSSGADPATFSARLGAKSTGVEIGSRLWGGGSHVPLLFNQDTLTVATVSAAHNWTFGDSTGNAGVRSFTLQNTNASALAYTQLALNANGSSNNVYAFNSSYAYDSSNYAGFLGLVAPTGLSLWANGASGVIRFETGASAASTNARLLIGANGNVMLGSGLTFGWGSTSAALNVANIDTKLTRVAAGTVRLDGTTPNLTIGTQQTTQGALTLTNTAAGAYGVTIQSSNSTTAAWTLTLPPNAGSNTYVLQTDGSGNTSWVAPTGSGATPGGSSGNIQYNNAGAFGGMAGTSWDATNRSLTITGATVTASKPVLDMTQTWNNASTVFSAIKLTVTNTSSAGLSKLIDLTVGSTNVYASKEGLLGITGASASGCGLYVSVAADTAARAGVYLDASNRPGLFLGGGSSAADAIIFRAAAATLQLGAADAASPVAQTLQVQNVSTGTTNTAGTNFTINGSRGTGTGAGGSIIFQVASAGTSGTSQNALATALTIDSTKRVTLTGDMYGQSVWLPNNGTFGSTGAGCAFATNGGSNYPLTLRANALSLDQTATLAWNNGNSVSGTMDTIITRAAAATLQLGAADVSSGNAVAQTLRVQSTTAASQTAPDFTIQGSRGTTAGGGIIFQTAATNTQATALKILANKSVVVGDGANALSTTATDGFLYIPTCAGLPTGVPTTQTGTAPLVVDTTNNKLYVYVGGTWTAMN